MDAQSFALQNFTQGYASVAYLDRWKRYFGQSRRDPKGATSYDLLGYQRGGSTERHQQGKWDPTRLPIGYGVGGLPFGHVLA